MVLCVCVSLSLSVCLSTGHTFHPNHGSPSGNPAFPVWDPSVIPQNTDSFCPMNMYRAGGDIGNNFGSTLGEMYCVVQYGDRPQPLSRPGCWAYPDMNEIGNFGGEEPLRSDEERSHWSMWSIVSAPLVLGFDMSDATVMDRVWDTITNTAALDINHAWAGDPGTLIKSYPATGVGAPRRVGQSPCVSSMCIAGSCWWRM
eukprot:m.681930 g.681930  ORF g.681930 m.681930 type:complete len:200 (-) comp22815_c0_seq8:4851-5450(-)